MSTAAGKPDQNPARRRYQVNLGTSRRWLTVAQILELTTLSHQPPPPVQPRGARAAATAALLEVAAACQRQFIEQLVNEPAPERPSITVDDVLARMREVQDEC